MPTGFYGKLPTQGDFLRRRLPDSFVQPWDAWLQSGMAEARETLGEDGFAEAWASAPAWRFRLPALACGPDPVAGLLLPSEDLVGRRFPLTLATTAAAAPAEAWFAGLHEAAATPGHTADSLAAALPEPWLAEEKATPEGWWTTPDHHWPLAALPPPALFRVFLEGGG
ncbi:type VI secretion system-associated protein TagF [Falsiroseomonas sp. E2-1-a20]|uniref:type VI secretion system-associated protein TagF n=1 Tax=Falsiroseomonas sp. E2-1-a20 TaxID=3239300 RepID=UPI003F3F069F